MECACTHTCMYLALHRFPIWWPRVTMVVERWKCGHFSGGWLWRNIAFISSQRCHLLSQQIYKAGIQNSSAWYIHSLWGELGSLGSWAGLEGSRKLHSHGWCLGAPFSTCVTWASSRPGGVRAQLQKWHSHKSTALCWSKLVPGPA